MSCDMWFGTQDYSTWVPTPLSGADVSPGAWGDSGVLLNGGGYSLNSYGSHKRYDFSWRSTSSRETAQLMKSFYEGTFGRGKLYFQDPLTLDTNVLPARWADPSITADFEGPSLVPGLDGHSVSRTNFQRLQLPVRAMQYEFKNYVQPKIEDAGVYVPIPEGYIAFITSFYETTDPGAGVYFVEANGSTAGGTPTKAGPLSPTVSTLVESFSGLLPGSQSTTGMYLYIGGSGAGVSTTGTVTVHALQVRLFDASRTSGLPPLYTHWYGGQGNAGVRFEGPPSYINNSGRDGGQIEFAATFVESIL